jgi:hypothetical protein
MADPNPEKEALPCALRREQKNDSATQMQFATRSWRSVWSYLIRRMV